MVAYVCILKWPESTFIFQYSFPGTQFLTFEHVTLVPYEPKLIDYSLLNERQVCVKKIISLFQILVIVDIKEF